MISQEVFDTVSVFFSSIEILIVISFLSPSTVIFSSPLYPSARQVSDPQTKEKYFVTSQVLYDSKNIPMGIIIVGRTIQEIYDLIRIFVYGQLLTGFVLAILGTLVLKKASLSFKKTPVAQPKSLLNPDEITSIHFSKEKSAIIINEHVIPITYATNQYFMCSCLFSSPKKKWESDELLKKFGEENQPEGWRKIYDAMVSINKKSNQLMKPKLIITNKKTYQVNPDLVAKVN